jgi:hypothetical protein|tara:strand:- start:2292 stop:2813 length:522 start_codon:yes stop_codon:yes gene_type:complete
MLIFSLSSLLNYSSNSETIIFKIPLEFYAREFFIHGLFGTLVGLFTFKPSLIILSTTFAILTDIDHTLWLTGMSTIARTNHAIPMSIVISIIIGLIFRNKKRINYRLTFTAFGAMLSHLAYDSISEYQPIPILSPITLDEITLLDNSWIVFLLVAILVNIIGLLISKKNIRKK